MTNNTSIIVTLTSTASYTAVPAITLSLKTLTILKISDCQGQQKVVANVKELPHPIVLWSGSSYVSIGDWTQAQAEAQLISIISGSAS